MTERDDELEQLLRPWMHRHAPAAPSDLVLRIYEEIEAMPEHAPSRGWRSRLAAWPAAWTATAAAALILVVATGAMVVGFSRLPAIGEHPTPTPLVSPSPSHPTAVADALIAAWNSGDGQQAAGLYSIPQPQILPPVRFFIDSVYGNETDGYATPSAIVDAVAAWHAKGTVLTRTGDVLTQGPYAAYPVTWTSADGSFDGVEVLRISTAQLVTEQYLIGASSATGSAATSDAAQLVADLRDALNTSNGSAASTLLAPNAEAWGFRDGVPHYGPVNVDLMISSIDQGSECCQATIDRVLTQGPFVVHTTVVTNATQHPGQEIDGVEVLELNGDGQIERYWRFDTPIDLPSS